MRVWDGALESSHRRTAHGGGRRDVVQSSNLGIRIGYGIPHPLLATDCARIPKSYILEFVELLFTVRITSFYRVRVGTPSSSSAGGGGQRADQCMHDPLSSE